MLVLEILETALKELDEEGYARCSDRILSALDKARIKLFPPAGRTVEVHQQVTKACQQASQEIAETIVSKKMDEENAYLFLAVLGMTIEFPQLQTHLKRTIERLKIEQSVAA